MHNHNILHLASHHDREYVIVAIKSTLAVRANVEHL